ncbi:hypothetical protein COX67_04305 [Candidatus Falkowbacteria bacterium CG_4_10_14_0_2_um_filter_36_22]|uniref:DOD-type homing endonuclease domain-containing protein n=2 Tax=Candidatus Falkowiibacteriota TaxID=1752728 RepID=A0A1J4TET8_9BACT|nr:MAG: hypothetical protein AUJ27_00345 [Candidatus Falkowbacteria bacterium CG1_02_37_44]PIV50767.1 MAG: hypothetical protein COS18_03990 [Candidatus Falkowbacteria bacterium CG02_land_8_20_14_3_00_36_14]PIX11959.1 MAG: hypothetical protein COZ73_01450 [Candidatus Falkowbacteria bacterium CG_4_8_14_3_um_filter_36_11]PJA10528.1 MAG: hypothetical protein COX67_04305 [Candidatus Falkowbacteria bacterium CG_4_10_14_0_2_um_filter_36_22]
MYRFNKSHQFFKKANKIIPLASQTFSKSYLQYIKGQAPLFAVRAKGARIWDIDGNKYIDFINGLLPVILGYQNLAVDDAINRQLKKGIVFSLSSPLEYELAELLIKHIPCAEMVRFGKNGSDVTTGAVRLARATTGRDHVAACYDKETEILTKSGFKKFKDLDDNEIVATLNPNTGYLEYHQIYAKIKYYFTGKMIHFLGQRVDLLVTPDHRIYRKFRLRTGHHFKIEDANDALKRKTITQMTSMCKWKGKIKNKFSILKINQTRPAKGVNFFSVKEFVRFMGWYLSEGFCIEQKRGRYEVCIAQDEKNERKSQEIFTVIKKLGFKPYRNNHHICFNSKELVQYLKQFGRCKDKYIPEWIKNLPKDCLSIFADTMIKGDGTFENGRIRKFYSTSRKLIDGMQELLLKIGYSTTISEYKNTGFSKNKIYHLNISQERFLGCWSKEKYYKGNVYCISVPNHIILVRRNGKIIWSGNCGYHGWHDWYIGSTARNLGVPKSTQKLTHKFEYNNIKSLEKIFKENKNKVAAVIMEPMNYIEPEKNFLQKVKTLAHKNGALLIFDEVITGFRFSLGGAQKLFGVTPDLAAFGKSMANGMPISALVGKKKYMKKIEDIFYSFTNGGETLSIAAAIATIKEMEKKKVIEHIWKLGAYLIKETDKLIKKNNLEEVIKIKGKPCWSLMFAYPYGKYSDLEIKSYLQQELIQAGFLWYGQHNMSFSHTKKDISGLVSAYANIFPKLKELLDKDKLRGALNGEPITNIFKVR